MCAQIGTLVLTQETPPSVVNTNNTANAFMVGFTDWGPVGASGVLSPVTSLTQASALIGAPNGGLVQQSRTSTNATIYDSADVFFREGGANLYLSRVVGPNPTFGVLSLQDTTGGTAATLTAAYVGPGSSGVNIVINNTGAAYTATIQDSQSNVLAASPTLSNTTPKTDLIAWAASTNIVTATTGNGHLPKTIAATPLSAGTDDHASATLLSWSNAMNLGFGNGLGPGQIMAPGVSNTALSGIWSTLASHAQSNNRVAILDGTDGNSASQAIAEVTAAALPSSIKGYAAIWAGNLQIPGIVSGTTRVVPPSPVVAALCARVDNQGNPNLAAAGTSLPLQYVSGINTLYTGPLVGDISTLNDNGVNVFSIQLGVLQNFGFVSAYATPQGDSIFWQFSHARLRMAIVAESQVIAAPFQFGQLDGQGQTLSAFAGALQGMLLGFYQTGSLFGATPTDAFTVSTGATVNPVSSLLAGNLIAQLAVRMSPFAQLVTIIVDAVPITTNLIQTSVAS